jgi:hypothetical protein
MKKFILFLTFIYLSICIPLPFEFNETVYADATYLRVITSDTPFYKNQGDDKPLFYLPYTYYVKVIYDSGEFLHVECYGNDRAALDGFVPKNSLFDDGQSVESPYPTITLTTSTNAVLFSDGSLNEPIQYIFPDRELHYYGTYTAGGDNIYFVGYNGRLGYIKESEVYPFSIPNHPNELTFLNDTTSDGETLNEEKQTNDTTAEDFFSLKIIIIVCLLFAGLVALFLALKGGSKNSQSTIYYDENEYE